MGRLCALLVVVALVAAAAPHCAKAEPSTSESSASKDRPQRFALFQTKKNVGTKPQLGFFGTIFHLILEQVNDTKSAYNQISELVSNQFADDNAITTEANPANNGTTETPKISRAEFLKILDRNLKGLARLRALEWREARKDSKANLRAYKDEIFSGKEHRNGR